MDLKAKLASFSAPDIISSYDIATSPMDSVREKNSLHEIKRQKVQQIHTVLACNILCNEKDPLPVSSESIQEEHKDKIRELQQNIDALKLELEKAKTKLAKAELNKEIELRRFYT